MLYSLLLRLYPASFRHEYASEMRPLFERRRRQVSGPGVLALWMRTVGEVAASATAAHADLLRQDLSYTLRVLRRAPGFASTAVLVVAIGIGATTAAFSVTDFVLIRPLPFARPDRLVKLFERTPEYGRLELSAANYRDWKAASTLFEGLGMYHMDAANLTGAGEPIRIEGLAVSFDLFPTLGVKPLIGRMFAESDDREAAPGTVVLSYRLWQTQFGGERDAVGRRVTLDAEPFTIIGVMPREFRFPNADVQFWRPLRFGEDRYADRTDNWMYAVGRLRPGATLAQARAEMEVIAAQSRAQYPKENANVGAALFEFGSDISEQSRLLLVALCGAAGCVLLIACANLANLLLARALERRRELAVRAAIGAGRERMVRQLMTESLLLAAVGGVVGIGVAFAAVPLLNRLVPASLPLASTPAVDFRVLVFAVVLIVVTGVAFGLAPVMRLGGEADLGGLRESARSGGGARESARSVLVVVEIVASIVLLVSAGLLLRALWTLQSRDPGFRSEGVLTMQTPLPIPRYGKVATRENFYGRVIAGVGALPGVSHAGFVSYLPMGKMKGGIWPVSLDGRPLTRADNQNAFLRYVTPGYFATVGIPLQSGRDINAADTADRPPVAVISESFIARYWPTENPASVLGRHFTFAFSDRVVVGVVGDVRMRGLERQSEPQVYLSSRQVPDGAIIGYIPRALVVRSSLPPESLAPAVRAVVRAVDPTLPVSEVATLAEIVDRDTASRSVQMRVIGAFAVIAFVLAAIGIHGVLAFAVSQRMQEIGVRMALGAQSGDILRMIVRRGLVLAAAGVIPGVALAYAAGRSMQALLVGITPGDVTTFASVVALSVVMTVAGTLVPALRAVRVDPLTALRAE